MIDKFSHGKDHHVWSYCLYLGLYEEAGVEYDLGVYVSRGSISLAAVFGPNPEEYLSGEMVRDGEPTGFMKLPIYKEAYSRYLHHQEGDSSTKQSEESEEFKEVCEQLEQERLTPPEVDKREAILTLALSTAELEDFKVLKQHYEIEIENMQKVIQSDSYDEDYKNTAEDVIYSHREELSNPYNPGYLCNRRIKKAVQDLTVPWQPMSRSEIVEYSTSDQDHDYGLVMGFDPSMFKRWIAEEPYQPPKTLDHQKDIDLFSSMLDEALNLRNTLSEEYLELEKELTRIIDPYASSSFETVDFATSPKMLVMNREEIRHEFCERDDLGWGAGITKNIEFIRQYLEKSKNEINSL